MTTLSEITAAPIEVVLNGKTYRFSRLRLSDQGELDSWLEGYALRRAQKLVAGMPDLPAKVKDAIYQKAVDTPIDARLEIEALGSAEGLALQLWLSLRQCHPNITREEIGDLLKMADVSLVRTLLNKSESKGSGPNGLPKDDSTLSPPPATQPTM